MSFSNAFIISFFWGDLKFTWKFHKYLCKEGLGGGGH